MAAVKNRFLCSIWANLLFAFSAAAFTAPVAAWWFAIVVGDGIVASASSTLVIAAANVLIVFILALLLGRRFNVLTWLVGAQEKTEKAATLIALLITGYIVFTVTFDSYININSTLQSYMSANSTLSISQVLLSERMLTFLLRIGYVIAGIAALFFVYAAVFAVVNQVRRWPVLKIWNGTDTAERVFFASSIVILGSLIAYVYNMTSMPYAHRDIIYQMDNDYVAEYMYSFLYMISSDERYFFFNLINYPVTLIADIISNILFFVKFPVFYYIISVCIAILIITCAIMLARMAAVKGVDKVFFFSGYCLLYPTLVFAIVVEKYVVSTFLVILLIFICVNKMNGKFAAGIAAAGVLSTNVFFIPYLSYDKDKKIWAVNMLKYILVFIVISFFCGALFVLVNLTDVTMLRLNAYTGVNVGWGERGLQFLNFVGSCFITPVTIIHKPDVWRYELAQPDSINWLGVVLLALATAGFIANRKSRFAQLSFSWVAYAFVIFVVIGWQAARNEMFLSSFYFGWAFFVLIFMLFERLFGYLPSKCKAVKYAVYSAAIAAMAVINVRGLADLIGFGVEYYPVLYFFD